MKCEIQKVMNNTRFRILKIEGHTYILDLSQSIWNILFPFLTWIVPNTIYKVDENELHQRLQLVGKDQSKNNISILLIGGIGIALGNLLTALTDYFYIQSTMVVNSIIAGIVMGIIIVVRFVLSNRNKNNFYKKIAPNLLSKERIWIRPKSFKHFIQALFGYIFFLVFFIAMFVLFITDGNIMLIISATIFALFLSIFNVVYVGDGPTTVKFKKK
ncbi:DUF443 family protein [Alkalihalobacillus hemicellulosilyticus]|uniref:Regulatory protein n=1 Tax=Halalkalibacter hemicellulosilyticusJCM 9152 TaxID=1236971 RepID=W4QJ05_9BACI|nr:DUF443 family protein [Halalkalibacter hemicellulosilyticus]GAE32066.1 regulatory protein [Halalkalibacter hemicellulosilyticusJCM 9152]